MMTIDDMLSEVAKIVDTAPNKSQEIKKVPEKIKTELPKADIGSGTIKAGPETLESCLSLDPGIPEKNADENKLLKKVSLSLRFAKEAAYCIEKAAGIIGVNAVIAVTDAGGNLILLEAMDDSYIASVNAARDKAYTAVALKMPTHEALKESRGGSLDGLTNGGGILMLGGGYPISHGGAIIGGIGVSGGTKEQDMLLAHIGIEYLKKRINSL